MSTIEQVARMHEAFQNIQIANELLDPRITAEGWPSYKDIGDPYCSYIYPRTPHPRPVGLGPVSQLALCEANAILKPAEKTGFKYGMSVAFGRNFHSDNEELLTSVENMHIPLVYFNDVLHGEQDFKNQDFHDGELWRVVRFGAQHGERLAVPFIRFNTSALSILGQEHYTFDNSRFYKKEPAVQTYAPMTGNAEEFLLGVNGTDISARLRITAQFQGI